MQGVRVVIAGGASALFFGGVFNVAELPFASGPLEASDAGYSALVALFGLGFIAGSLAGSRGGTPALLRRRFLQGTLLMGTGFLCSAAAPSVLVGLLTFAIAGFGNGMLLVHERLIVQETVPDGLMGRAFGVKDALASWAFGVAFVAGGALLTFLTTRTLIGLAGAGVVLVALACAVALRRGARKARVAEGGLGGRGGALGDLGGGENSADLVGRHDPGSALLDHGD